MEWSKRDILIPRLDEGSFQHGTALSVNTPLSGRYCQWIFETQNNSDFFNYPRPRAESRTRTRREEEKVTTSTVLFVDAKASIVNIDCFLHLHKSNSIIEAMAQMAVESCTIVWSTCLIIYLSTNYNHEKKRAYDRFFFFLFHEWISKRGKETKREYLINRSHSYFHPHTGNICDSYWDFQHNWKWAI